MIKVRAKHNHGQTLNFRIVTRGQRPSRGGLGAHLMRPEPNEAEITKYSSNAQLSLHMRASFMSLH